MNKVVPIDVPRDLTALHRFLPRFAEQAASAECLAPTRLGGGTGKCDVPFGYRLWIEHLLLIKDLPGVEYTADEACGIAVLRGTLDEFWAQHFPCPQCNCVLPQFAKFCPCGWQSGEGH